MGRKLLCPNPRCGCILNEDILRERNSLNTCLVCGAALDGSDNEDSQTAPEEELITWYYIEWKTNDSYFIIEKAEAEKQNLPVEDEDIVLKYTFKASKDCDAAKEVLRREYKPDAFMPNAKQVIKPDELWIAEGKCPRCHSSNIQLVQRKWSFLTGFRTNAVDRVCVNCKHRF